MIIIRKSKDRGTTKFDWLDSKHTFSFGRYFDKEHMGFGDLRVINEDIVDPASGFDMHSHNDMEIITYVLEGGVAHRDSIGNNSIIVPGEVQRMTAGTGILHSEMNENYDKPLHLLQIWIIPEKTDLAPSYEQKNFDKIRKPGNITLVASKDGRAGSITIHQDANMYVLDLDSPQTFNYDLNDGRIAWVQMARGSAILNGQLLTQGDGAAVSHEKALEFKAEGKAEIIIFDLAGE